MPKKKPCTYVQAEVMYWSDMIQAIMEEDKNPPPLGHNEMVNYISNQGFHIELKGDEYKIIDN
jgi:hypothetical protein